MTQTTQAPKVEGYMVRLNTTGSLKAALLLHKLLYTRDPKWPYITHLQVVANGHNKPEYVEVAIRGANPVQATKNPDWLWYESNASSPVFINHNVITHYLAAVNAMVGKDEKLETFFENVAISSDNKHFYCVDYERTLLYMPGKIDLTKLYNKAFESHLVATDSTEDDCQIYEENWGDV